MKRFKNYGLWAAMLAYLPIVSDALGFYKIDFVLPGNYDKLVVGLLGILVLAGIVSNPNTDNKGFGDDKK
ncbi:holin [Neobacillus sp. 19]|uniref:holin n=1 Tax=Neobacillus sp. 19 TaxID=3394458 RepID=UPI003BF67EA6